MEPEFLKFESGSHYTIRLPVEGHDLVVKVDKNDFTITIPAWEYMEVKSIVKIIVQLCKDKKDNPVVKSFLNYLHEPENKEELENFIIVSSRE